MNGECIYARVWMLLALIRSSNFCFRSSRFFSLNTRNPKIRTRKSFENFAVATNCATLHAVYSYRKWNAIKTRKERKKKRRPKQNENEVYKHTTDMNDCICIWSYGWSIYIWLRQISKQFCLCSLLFAMKIIWSNIEKELVSFSEYFLLFTHSPLNCDADFYTPPQSHSSFLFDEQITIWVE